MTVRRIITAFVFAGGSGHFRITDFLLFFPRLLLLNYFLFNLFLFLQKSGGGGGGTAPSSAQSLEEQLMTINNYYGCQVTKSSPSRGAMFHRQSRLQIIVKLCFISLPRKNRASFELLYKSKRPQVSMGYMLINHLGCCLLLN